MLALATGIKSVLISIESLNNIFNKLSNFSTCILPFLSKITCNKIFTISSGNAAGLKVQYSGLGSNATIYYGQSLIEKLTSFLSDTLSASDGQLSNRETTINQEVSEQSKQLLDLNKQMESLRNRYIQQFTVMEQAVTSLKSTGEYLTNLFESMNKDD